MCLNNIDWKQHADKSGNGKRILSNQAGVVLLCFQNVVRIRPIKMMERIPASRFFG